MPALVATILFCLIGWRKRRGRPGPLESTSKQVGAKVSRGFEVRVAKRPMLTGKSAFSARARRAEATIPVSLRASGRTGTGKDACYYTSAGPGRTGSVDCSRLPGGTG